ncbi:hypothetical protein HBI46_158950 [Parastagonospora nodorum]|nr:hypothetical protein HBH47_217510 [Parastagonospora nodorum]KAH4962338.1 hypothetical protein HBI78_134040 [Parastagonospora nodorum]KAH5411588.1 hypothetical protein HBI46_158950 [Parastagonospora nodorum]KAH5530101.1 hypothetical protein HBI27_224840 [Parastagonospora nodorum]KAH6293857.1 hypothetical protein HBI39_171770 [Parastagonospora nodorum]
MMTATNSRTRLLYSIKVSRTNSYRSFQISMLVRIDHVTAGCLRSACMLIVRPYMSLYSGGPTPTTAVQRGPSIPRDNELKNMRIYDIGKSNGRGKKRKHISTDDCTEMPRYATSCPEAFQPTTVYDRSVNDRTPNLATSVMLGGIYGYPTSDVLTFRCHHANCHDQEFSRWPDYKRHYNGAHATIPTIYWCDVEECPRSKAPGNRPFPRKDKLNDHAKSIHGVRN